MDDIQYAFKVVWSLMKGTPWWVFVIFGYLVFVGISAMKDRNVYIPRMFIVPVILIFIKFRFFATAPVPQILEFAVGMAVGLGFGYLRALAIPVVLARTHGALYLRMPGSLETIVLFMGFFAIRYVFGYMESQHHDLFHRYRIVEIGISSLFSGYFWGRSFGFLRTYYRFLKRR